MTFRTIVKMWPSALVGLAIGIVLIPLSDVGIDNIRGSYDDRNPVVVSTGAVVAQAEDWVEIAVSGTKHRQCFYVSLAAYSQDGDGLLRDVFIARVDKPARGATRPLGEQEFGTWRVWPVSGSVRVQLWVTHQCEGRLVRSLMANVPIGGKK